MLGTIAVVRLAPTPVLAGLRVGLGLALTLVSFDLMATAPIIALITLGVLLELPFCTVLSVRADRAGCGDRAGADMCDVRARGEIS